MSYQQCVCNLCAKSVELSQTLFTPGEDAEPCFTCDECRRYDGDHSKPTQERRSCGRYQAPARLKETREPWWGFCRNIVRMYPAYLERYRALHDPSMTANYTGLPGDSTPSRSTEDVATRELTQTEQRSLDAVEAAIRATQGRRDGKERLRLIGLVYWPKQPNKALRLYEAADKLFIGYRTAIRWHGDFIRTVHKFRKKFDE